MVHRLGISALLLLGMAFGALAGGVDDEFVAVEGRLTPEGVECPAFRAGDGTLYTLLGDVGDFRPGDEVCIYGRPGGISYCMQGIPFSLPAIAGSCEEVAPPAAA